MSLHEYGSKLGVLTPITASEKNEELTDLLRATFLTLQQDVARDQMTAAQMEAQLQIQKENQAIIQQVTENIVSMLEQQTQKMTDAYREIAEKIAGLQIEIKNPINDERLSEFSDSVKRSVIESAKANDANMKDIKKALQNIKPASVPKIEIPKYETPEVVTEWEFNFIRDDNGFTKKIEAVAR
jgi:hypothetical protein